MGCMKEKYTEIQEELYKSYVKLLEAREVLMSSELKEAIDHQDPFVYELFKLSCMTGFVIKAFEHSKLFGEFGLDLLHEATNSNKNDISDNQEAGA